MDRKKLLLLGLIFLLFVTPAHADFSYDQTTETSCNNGICNLILYSGYSPKFFDEVISKSKDITEFYHIVYLKRDEKSDIVIRSFNVTDVDFKLKTIESEKSETIPFYACKNDPELKEAECYQMNYVLNALERDFHLGINLLEYRYLKFGLSSTTIMLQDSGSENLADTHVDHWGPNNNYGTVTENQIDGTSGAEAWPFYIFNITSIPDSVTIDDSQLYLYLSQEDLLSPESFSVTSHQYPNRTWNETNVTWNNYDSTINATATDTKTIRYDSAIGWHSWDVTDVIDIDYQAGNPNTSITLNVTVNGGSPSGSDDAWFYSREYATVGLRPYVNITYSIIDDYPTWSLNSTNSTLAGTPIEHRLYLEDNTALNSYIFQFCNGTYDGSNCGGEASSGLSYYDNFDDGTNWSEEGDCASYWLYDDATVSSGTGPQDGDHDSTNFVFMETSGGSCDGTPSSGYLMYLTTIDWDAGTNDNVSFRTNRHGDSDLGTMIMQENSSGSWIQLGSYSQTGADGNSGLVWSYFSIDASALTGTGHVRYYTSGHSSYTGDASIDAFNITSEAGAGSNWINDSAVVITGTGNWSNVTKVVNSTEGSWIAWRVYFNDSLDQWNASDVFSYNTTGAVAGNNYTRLVNLSLDWKDPTNRTLTANRESDQTITFTDATNRTLDAVRESDQTITFTDSGSRTLTANRLATLTATWTDEITVTVLKIYSRLVSLTLNWNDATNRTLDAVRESDQTITFTDSGSRTLTANREADLVLSWIDTVTAEIIGGDVFTRLVTLFLNLNFEQDTYIRSWESVDPYRICFVLEQIGESRAYLCIYEDASYKILIKGS